MGFLSLLQGPIPNIVAQSAQESATVVSMRRVSSLIFLIVVLFFLSNHLGLVFACLGRGGFRLRFVLVKGMGLRSFRILFFRRSCSHLFLPRVLGRVLVLRGGCSCDRKFDKI